MWKRIPGYLEYEIDTDGNIRSLHKRHKKPKLLKQLNRHGYPSIILHKDGKTRKFYIHRLVWETFKGPIPDGMFVLHGPGGDKSNCSLDYLRLGTHAENQADRVADGTNNAGSSNYNAKLTEEQARYIKARARDGMNKHTLARLFEVSWDAIHYIVKGRTWRHVKGLQRL